MPSRSAMGSKATAVLPSVCAAVQLPAVAQQAFAGLQNHRDGVVLHAPDARNAVEPGGFRTQPVQVGDGEEAVGVGAAALMRGVPLLPFGGEGGCVPLIGPAEIRVQCA